jgi:hydroxyacyl-ACP dehydratase HTD2-like protein with hotdog domain
MWAGGDITFDVKNPLKVGQKVYQETAVSSVEQKRSSSRGEIVFVELTKKVYNDAGLSVHDSRKLAYFLAGHDTSKQHPLPGK